MERNCGSGSVKWFRGPRTAYQGFTIFGFRLAGSMLQTKPRSWSRLTFASGLAGFCPVGRPLGSYPLGWFVGLLEKCPCCPWRLLTTALTTINLAYRTRAATGAPAWGGPAPGGALSGRTDGPSITYVGFSTVRARRGRSRSKTQRKLLKGR